MNLPHDTLIVTLNYPINILGLIINIPKKVGFRFTNFYKHLMFLDLGFDGSNDWNKWSKDKGVSEIMNESLYYMAVAYCKDESKKIWFKKDKLKIAIALADKEATTKIIETWKLSENFGATVKKKVIRKAK